MIVRQPARAQIDRLESRLMMSASARDPWREPFSADSIWNTPIGEGAIYAAPKWSNANVGFFDSDEEYFHFSNPGEPLKPIYQNTFSNRTPAVTTSSQTFASVRIPDSYTVPGFVQGETPNAAAFFLRPDGRSSYQFEPIARPTAGGNLWGQTFSKGANYDQNQDLFGPGYYGSHYGSGLSALGGSVRRGELTGDEPIRHALKIEVDTRYLYKGAEGTPNRRGTYVWPAYLSDGASATTYGGKNTDMPDLAMGSLLAIAPSATEASLQLRTEPGRRLFHALQDYGAYIVDTSTADWNPNGGDYMTIAAEKGVEADFSGTYGYGFSVSSTTANDWHRDINTIYRNLKVITNGDNPQTIGGGGVRRAAPALPFAYGARKTVAPGLQIEAEDYNPGGKNVGYSDADDAQNALAADGTGNVGSVDMTAYRNDAVDVRRNAEADGSADGNWAVGWTAAGEWLKYDVNVPAAGTYELRFRVASGSTGGTLRVFDETGADLTGAVTFGGTGGWDAYTTVVKSNVALTAGNHTLRIAIDAGGFNFNWFSFATTNKIANGSFESDAIGHTGAPTGWTRSGVATSTIVGTGVTDGAKAARVTVANYTADSSFRARYSVLSQSLTSSVQAGRTYRLTGGWSNVSSGFGVSGALQYNNAYHTFSGNGPISFTFTYVAGTTLRLQLDLVKFSGSATSGSATFDNWSLVEV